MFTCQDLGNRLIIKPVNVWGCDPCDPEPRTFKRFAGDVLPQTFLGRATQAGLMFSVNKWVSPKIGVPPNHQF